MQLSTSNHRCMHVVPGHSLKMSRTPHVPSGRYLMLRPAAAQITAAAKAVGEIHVVEMKSVNYQLVTNSIEWGAGFKCRVHSVTNTDNMSNLRQFIITRDGEYTCVP